MSRDGIEQAARAEEAAKRKAKDREVRAAHRKFLKGLIADKEALLHLQLALLHTPGGKHEGDYHRALAQAAVFDGELVILKRVVAQLEVN